MAGGPHRPCRKEASSRGQPPGSLGSPPCTRPLAEAGRKPRAIELCYAKFGFARQRNTRSLPRRLDGFEEVVHVVLAELLRRRGLDRRLRELAEFRQIGGR